MMPCSWVKLPGGGVAIVKHAKPRAKKCRGCGAPAPLLCDWKIAPGKTCDAPVCEECALEVGPEKHLCPAHRRAWEAHPRNPRNATP